MLGLGDDQEQIHFVAKLICKYIMHKAELYLKFKPSIVGAASVLLALNLSIRKPICDALSLDHITSVEIPYNSVSLWNPKIEGITKIKA